MTDFELFHFPISHFNEKARWALDWKGIAHRRTSVLPGPQKLAMQRLSGQSQVPVLRHGEKAIAGSSQIVEYLEEFQPEPSLYPSDAGEREQALATQAWLDEELGPAVRRAMFFEVLQDPDYFVLMFTQDRGRATQRAYRLGFPAVSRVMKSEMDITPETSAASLKLCHSILDRLERERGAAGYLIGDQFSIADLTAAALLIPAFRPKGGPVMPTRSSKVASDWFDRWTDHPLGDWVRTIYDRHRGSSSAV